MLYTILEKIDSIFFPLFSFFSFLPTWLIDCLSFIGNIKLILTLFFLLSLKRLRLTKHLDGKAHYRFFSLGTLFTVLYLLKITVTRLRPEYAQLNVSALSFWDNLFKNEFHSFPSSHAAVAIFFVMTFRKSLILKIVAILMCISRVVSNQHYPSDVIAGVLIGYTMYFVGNGLYKKILDQIKKGKFITYP